MKRFSTIALLAAALPFLGHADDESNMTIPSYPNKIEESSSEIKVMPFASLATFIPGVGVSVRGYGVEIASSMHTFKFSDFTAVSATVSYLPYWTNGPRRTYSTIGLGGGAEVAGRHKKAFIEAPFRYGYEFKNGFADFGFNFVYVFNGIDAVIPIPQARIGFGF